MTGIYQEIWNADQSQNGVEAILDSEVGSEEQGYVKVNSQLDKTSDPDLRVLTKVHIPESKKNTYELCRRLFNNYTLAEPMPEFETPEERREIHDFVSAITETEPMEAARCYIQQETGTTVSRERWYNTIVEMWFRRFSSGGDPELSGFEHVVVGEQEKSKVQGHHFWWKYYLDDGFARETDDGKTMPDSAGFNDDRITYHGSKLAAGQKQFPESVTISYRWQAPDYDNSAFRPLFKKIGGFFVGCSVEGLMALGTVRAHKGVRAPQVAEIEGARYDLKLYHSPGGQQIRTFYPVFLGPIDPVVSLEGVRIVAAMVNPRGDDAGFETVTLVNIAPEPVSITDWRLQDKNNKIHVMEEKIMQPGEFFALKLSGDNIQLSNKGGEIRLFNAGEQEVHRVSYSKTEAKQQGATILF